MPPEVARTPLSWYVSKIERGEPFTSLLYGDGELNVAAGLMTGAHYTEYAELVTPRLAEELRAALALNAPDVVYGTDPHLIHYETYQGGDAIDSLARCDEVRRPIQGSRHPDAKAAQRGPLAKILREMPELAADLDVTARGSAHAPTRRAS